MGEYTRKHEPSSIHVRTMHLTLIFIVIISYSTAYSHPLLLEENQQYRMQKPQQHELELESRQNNELNSSASRPVQNFFKKLLSAFRLRSSDTTMLPPTTTQRISAPTNNFQEQSQENPHFVDFSTYLLDSLLSSNTAIKFSYLEPNTTNLKSGNYSVITFLVPHSIRNRLPQKGFISQFLALFQNPWNRAPRPATDTVYSQFPSFLEYVAQRVQAYYSIYKYTDDSRLNNTIVVDIPEVDIYAQPDPLSDDLVETTTDYQQDTTLMDEIENENELLTTTEVNL
ncbi:unnamed protein product [Chironomus riparius]|uniref:Uncharacterized protein n=1 Tax=Chironomus riparius TaxID=315576 RepID=A0A9N9WPA5_9DIPT|nr:unnamed protein product [Chironomus riparius]